MTSKTIHAWFQTLPFEIYDLAVANTSPHTLTNLAASAEDAIMMAFSWSDTPEGGAYWTKIYNELEVGTLPQSQNSVEVIHDF